jgi:hypothetical protein
LAPSLWLSLMTHNCRPGIRVTGSEVTVQVLRRQRRGGRAENCRRHASETAPPVHVRHERRAIPQFASERLGRNRFLARLTSFVTSTAKSTPCGKPSCQATSNFTCMNSSHFKRSQSIHGTQPDAHAGRRTIVSIDPSCHTHLLHLLLRASRPTVDCHLVSSQVLHIRTIVVEHPTVYYEVASHWR